MSSLCVCFFFYDKFITNSYDLKIIELQFWKKKRLINIEIEEYYI